MSPTQPEPVDNGTSTLVDGCALALVPEHEEPTIEERLISLMDSYERRIYTFLLMLLHNATLAEDCAQDTFMRAYENLRKGKPVNAGWLFTVARNRALDELKARSRVHTGQELLEQVTAPRDFVADADVWEAMWMLPDSHREVLYLYAVAGFKTYEIGAILGIGSGAVRQRLYRARQRFRAVYGV